MDKEEETMLRSRQIAKDLGLNMKIGDVEYQGDHTKAIFYYIADERVDFRELIKVLAESFRIRRPWPTWMGVPSSSRRPWASGPDSPKIHLNSFSNTEVP